MFRPHRPAAGWSRPAIVRDHSVHHFDQLLADLTHPDALPAGVRALEHHIEQIRAQRQNLRTLEDADKIAELNRQIKKLDAQRAAIEVLPTAGQVILSRPMIKSPDLGESMTRNRKVSAIIVEALPVSLVLQSISIPIP